MLGIGPVELIVMALTVALIAIVYRWQPPAIRSTPIGPTTTLLERYL